MKRLRMNQRGFTLIELLVAMAISGAIGGVTLTSIYQVGAYQSMDRARMSCVKQVENAIHYIVRDAQMAQVVTVTPSPDADGFPLTLRWTEWNKDDDSNIDHEVEYRLSLSGTELERSYEVGSDPPVVMTVARYLDNNPATTSCAYSGGAVNLEITARINGFPKDISESRKTKIIPRPD